MPLLSRLTLLYDGSTAAAGGVTTAISKEEKEIMQEEEEEEEEEWRKRRSDNLHAIANINIGVLLMVSLLLLPLGRRGAARSAGEEGRDGCIVRKAQGGDVVVRKTGVKCS